MKGKYQRVMSVDDLFQALFQDKSFFEEHGITHVRYPALYFTPCDAAGNEVKIRDENGVLVEGYETAGCYHSAADGYETTGELAPRTVKLAGAGVKRSGKKDGRRLKPS